MNIIFDSVRKNGSLHHAYCIVGERRAVCIEIAEGLESELKIKSSGNPDFFHGEYDSFGVDEGRALKEMQEMHSFSGGKKIFLIAANTLTHEAQNSLLKVFEEPTEDTHFFLVMPSAETLLPTLRSRLVILAHESDPAAETRKRAAEFLKSSKAKRIALAKDIAEEISDEDATRTDALALLSEIECQLHSKIGKRSLTREEAADFEELLRGKSYLSDRSASVKMLLEHIALLLPVI